MSNQPDELHTRVSTVVNVLNYAAYTYVRFCQEPGQGVDAQELYKEATEAHKDATNYLLDLLRHVAASPCPVCDSRSDDMFTWREYQPASVEDARARIARLRDYFYTLSQEPNADPLMEAVYSQLDNTLLILEIGDKDE